MRMFPPARPEASLSGWVEVGGVPSVFGGGVARGTNAMIARTARRTSQPRTVLRRWEGRPAGVGWRATTTARMATTSHGPIPPRAAMAVVVPNMAAPATMSAPATRIPIQARLAVQSKPPLRARPATRLTALPAGARTTKRTVGITASAEMVDRASLDEPAEERGGHESGGHGSEPVRPRPRP